MDTLLHFARTSRTRNGIKPFLIESQRLLPLISWSASARLNKRCGFHETLITSSKLESGALMGLVERWILFREEKNAPRDGSNISELNGYSGCLLSRVESGEPRRCSKCSTSRSGFISEKSNS